MEKPKLYRFAMTTTNRKLLVKIARTQSTRVKMTKGLSITPIEEVVEKLEEKETRKPKVEASAKTKGKK